MITNFEEITAKLTKDEKYIIDELMIYFNIIERFKKTVKTPEIIKYFRNNCYVALQPPRLRKMINFIRSNGLLPIIGTSKGYFVSYDKEVIKSEILSLSERSDAILNAANGLRTFIK